jgi:FAD/FMN-containing dehydrogenase
LNRGSGVLDAVGLNRFLSFDRATGLVHAEAGVSLEELIDTLLPRGWFLPTTPGTKFVTLGGAIAADVHGKNHHRDGSFGQFVRQLHLMTADGTVLRCSPDENADVFWATVGGMGLTGVILDAVVQLKRVETAFCRVRYQRTKDLDQTLAAFSETDSTSEYSVAWIDCLASGTALGRSVLMLGREAEVNDLPVHLRSQPLAQPKKRKLAVPFSLPNLALNRLSIGLFNTLFYAKNKDHDAVVDKDAYFYPLDSINAWNRIYGSRGFVQYQALFPRETSRRGLIELLQKIARSKRASFLAVLKSSGVSNPSPLSFLFEGHTLALDFPVTTGLPTFLADLDELLLKYGGRLYLAKDAMMSPEVFAAMYPRLPEFRAVRDRLDPTGRFSSSQARRLRIIQ